jgi:hypothetical protein
VEVSRQRVDVAHERSVGADSARCSLRGDLGRQLCGSGAQPA